MELIIVQNALTGIKNIKSPFKGEGVFYECEKIGIIKGIKAVPAGN